LLAFAALSEARTFSRGRARLEKRMLVNDALRMQTRALAKLDCAGVHDAFKGYCKGGDLAKATDVANCGKTYDKKKNWDGKGAAEDGSGNYNALSKSPAPTIVGFGQPPADKSIKIKDINTFCGTTLVGTKGRQCVGSDGKGYNRLTLWGDWSACVNYQWVWCATQGKLPFQGGAKFIFPAGVPKDFTGPAIQSMTASEFCAISEMCSNGDELFNIAEGSEWTCATTNPAPVPESNWKKVGKWLASLFTSCGSSCTRRED